MILASCVAFQLLVLCCALPPSEISPEGSYFPYHSPVLRLPRSSSNKTKVEGVSQARASAEGVNATTTEEEDSKKESDAHNKTLATQAHVETGGDEENETTLETSVMKNSDTKSKKESKPSEAAKDKETVKHPQKHDNESKVHASLSQEEAEAHSASEGTDIESESTSFHTPGTDILQDDVTDNPTTEMSEEFTETTPTVLMAHTTKQSTDVPDDQDDDDDEEEDDDDNHSSDESTSKEKYVGKDSKEKSGTDTSDEDKEEYLFIDLSALAQEALSKAQNETGSSPKKHKTEKKVEIKNKMTATPGVGEKEGLQRETMAEDHMNEHNTTSKEEKQKTENEGKLNNFTKEIELDDRNNSLNKSKTIIITKKVMNINKETEEGKESDSKTERSQDVNTEKKEKNKEETHTVVPTKEEAKENGTKDDSKERDEKQNAVTSQSKEREDEDLAHNRNMESKNGTTEADDTNLSDAEKGNKEKEEDTEKKEDREGRDKVESDNLEGSRSAPLEEEIKKAVIEEEINGTVVFRTTTENPRFELLPRTEEEAKILETHKRIKQQKIQAYIARRKEEITDEEKSPA